jgi:uncharacterized protein DUF4386
MAGKTVARTSRDATRRNARGHEGHHVTTTAYTSSFDAPPPTEPNAASRSRKSLARRVGLLYLLAALPAPFALLYVPSRVFVPGDASTTADRVRASTTLLRMSVMVELWNCVLIIFVAFALYRLFQDVDRKLAAVTALLMWVAAPIQLLNVVFVIAPLMLTTSQTYLQAFSKVQVDALAYLFFRLHASGLIVAQVFWGLWLFPWGILAIRSGFIPKWIGVAEFFAGFGYVAVSVVMIMAPQIAGAVAPFGLALGTGEIPMGVWLLVWGARDLRVQRTT